jgi:hypothetical protein
VGRLCITQFLCIALKRVQHWEARPTDLIRFSICEFLTVVGVVVLLLFSYIFIKLHTYGHLFPFAFAANANPYQRYTEARDGAGKG